MQKVRCDVGFPFALSGLFLAQVTPPPEKKIGGGELYFLLDFAPHTSIMSGTPVWAFLYLSLSFHLSGALFAILPDLEIILRREVIIPPNRNKALFFYYRLSFRTQNKIDQFFDRPPRFPIHIEI